ncbi:MAG: type II toxin-antitoxin system VapC family toxin [Candidatus Pacebacteria bacterium]|nr:type II toxin-antitoxin system VapC family toxin [Candidatus Paceibacterota bacterium]
MIIGLDTNFLIDLLDISIFNPAGKFDDTVGRERIFNYLSGATRIVIPTPVIAETYIKNGLVAEQFIKKLRASVNLEIAPFDERAAIEFSRLYPLINRNRQKEEETKIKTTMDNQILTICSLYQVATLLTDDKGLTNRAAILEIETRKFVSFC